MNTQNLVWSAVDRIREEQIKQGGMLRAILAKQNALLLKLDHPPPSLPPARGLKDTLKAAFDPDKAITAKGFLFMVMAVYILRGGDLEKLLQMLLAK